MNAKIIKALQEDMARLQVSIAQKTDDRFFMYGHFAHINKGLAILAMTEDFMDMSEPDDDSYQVDTPEPDDNGPNEPPVFTYAHVELDDQQTMDDITLFFIGKRG